MRLTGILLTAALVVGAMGPAGAATMETYRWKNRVLVLFADRDAPQVAEQRDHLLRYQAELADRDMVIFAVIGTDRIEPIYGRAPSADRASALRSEFAVPAEVPFTALLVGLDGGVKWRENRPAQQQELFDLIDSMPMRQNRS